MLLDLSEVGTYATLVSFCVSNYICNNVNLSMIKLYSICSVRSLALLFVKFFTTVHIQYVQQ